MDQELLVVTTAVDVLCHDDDVLSHGASNVCEVLSRTLGRVAELAAVDGINMPDHMVIQRDNTTAQAKHSLFAKFLATLVAAIKFQTCTLII